MNFLCILRAGYLHLVCGRYDGHPRKFGLLLVLLYNLFILYKLHITYSYTYCLGNIWVSASASYALTKRERTQLSSLII